VFIYSNGLRFFVLFGSLLAKSSVLGLSLSLTFLFSLTLFPLVLHLSSGLLFVKGIVHPKITILSLFTPFYVHFVPICICIPHILYHSTVRSDVKCQKVPTHTIKALVGYIQSSFAMVN